MRCRHCCIRIYFTGVLYRSVDTKSLICYRSEDRLHHHY